MRTGEGLLVAIVPVVLTGADEVTGLGFFGVRSVTSFGFMSLRRAGMD